MGNSDYFDFEDKNVDFPFYNQKSLFDKNSLLIILATIFIFTFLIFGPIKFQGSQQQIIMFLITLIPLLMLTKCNLGYFFKKLTVDDLRLIILSYIGYMVYYLIVYFLLQAIAYPTTSSTIYFNDMNFLTLLVYLLQVIAEEIFRIFVFLVLMYFTYNYTKNRKKSIIISTIFMFAVFALLHVNTYNYNILQILLFQGLGSIFEYAGYLKTKNLAIPILVHMLINIAGWMQFLI